jgi:hypothetical protein
MDMSGMSTGMGVGVGVLYLAILILVGLRIAAPIKYLRS